MTEQHPDPAEAIASALARLRGGRGPGPHEHHSHRHAHPHPHAGHGGRGAGPRAWGGDRAGAPAVIRMLEALSTASDPLGVSEIADAIGVDQPRASRLVQQGVDREWVRREADPNDARRTRIALTDEGSRMIRGVRGERRERLGVALQTLTEHERDELARLLTKLADGWPG
ncbi:MarR family winged helix-turn-helix transcriptional regulator [Microbacterium esteraromaticum]|uniref:MarR family winged helix-turn-helix transcriptional regulator n=1 Tax=Microbacterium esteraromaticum TaxID=57043 RepID=UPI00195CCFFC|nr:MarR family winged helix-turn-helix transcriptional regulator [Microbacterium esteraromaticum]MBM7465908.1 DNA-binding MarR family transcriptional regulator [Microbacterium esteraromaticum]